MGHHLNFGAGMNQLPEPWQNLTVEHDIRKPLRFLNDSCSAILAEHVIEHVPFLQGIGFLQECRRVLGFGGTLRVGFPDVGRFLCKDGYEWHLALSACDYAQALAEEKIPCAERSARSRDEIARLLVGWGHQCAWTERTMAGALLAAGFRRVHACTYGTTPQLGLAGVDGHHKTVGRKVAELETTILEAFK